MNLNLKLLKSTFVVLFVRSFGALSQIILNYVVSKTLPPEVAGNFFWLLSLLIILMQIGTLGLHDVALKYISQNVREKKFNNAFFIYKRVICLCTIGLLVTTGLVYLVSPYLNKMFMNGDTELLTCLRLMILSTIFWGLSNITGFSLQALGKSKLAIFSLSIGSNIFFSILFLIFSSFNLKSAVIIYLISHIINWLTSSVALMLQLKKENKSEAITFDIVQLKSMAIPMWIIALMSTSLAYGGQFISAAWVSPSNIASYAISTKIAMTLSFFLMAINFILAPKIAHLHNSAKLSSIQKSVTDSIKILYMMALPIIFILIYFSKNILSLFGEFYADQSHILLILIIGQSINVFTGPTGYLLTMTNNENTMLNIYAFSGITTICLALVMTPLYGITGTAIATSSGIIIHNLTSTYYVKKKINISINPLL